MTSSPGFQRVTPSPTFHTMPLAPEPPMWWPPGGERNREDGLPSAAQTLLKFTPAAITRTVTSKAPGSGVSISSSWNASMGSPSRSSRMTHAAMVGGSSPGSASIWETWLASTATVSGTFLSRVRGCGMLPTPSVLPALEPVAALDKKEDGEGEGGHGQGSHAVEQEVPAGVDGVHEPAEVLAEETGHQRPDQEEGAHHGQPGGHGVQPVRVGVEVGASEGQEVLVLALELPGDLGEVVADVAQVLAAPAREVGQVADRLGGLREVVAL